jgi:hypothetical protein
VFLNFYQANIFLKIANGTWNKVVQNPKNKIVKKIPFGYIHSWGTQKECFTPKSLSKHYFE